MRVSNPDCSPVGINGRDVTVAPTGFAEVVSDDFPVLHTVMDGLAATLGTDVFRWASCFPRVLS